MDKVTITTQDKVEIAGLFWNAGSKQSVLLLHMMPATKESWLPLAEKLSRLEVNVLAIDFRGHGESSGGDYHIFSPEEHQAYIQDVEAAVEFLRQQNPESSIVMGGASIGANMTIKYMANHSEVARGVALSAGVDYYGVRAIDDIAKLSPEQRLFLVSAKDDDRVENSDSMIIRLKAASTANTEELYYETGGHGTRMWEDHPELIDKIISFLFLES